MQLLFFRWSCCFVCVCVHTCVCVHHLGLAWMRRLTCGCFLQFSQLGSPTMWICAFHLQGFSVWLSEWCTEKACLSLLDQSISSCHCQINRSVAVSSICSCHCQINQSVAVIVGSISQQLSLSDRLINSCHCQIIAVIVRAISQ